MERALLRSYIKNARYENHGELGKPTNIKNFESLLSSRELSILSLVTDGENKNGIDRKMYNFVMLFKDLLNRKSLRDISSPKNGPNKMYFMTGDYGYYLIKSNNKGVDFLMFDEDWAENDHQSKILSIKHNNGENSGSINYIELNKNKHSDVSQECLYFLTTDERNNYQIKSKHYNDFSAAKDEWDFDLTYHDYSSIKREDRSK